MKNYPEYKGLNLPAIDKQILDFWQAENVFERSVTNRDGAPNFVFYEGPPSANGMPGIHHVMSRTIKDLFCRYKTLKGFKVDRKGGWDTHGLPVELGVEKQLGITKEDIGKSISVADYNEACRKDVMKFTDVWNRLTQQMGYWVDLDNPYITYENKYIETLWWILKELHTKGYLYKGYTIQPFSPAAGTGLSSHELNLPGCYKTVKDTSAVAQFKVVRNDRSAELFRLKDNIEKEIVDPTTKLVFQQEQAEDIYFLAWTTTPWTLPSNTALAVGPNVEYNLVTTRNIYTNQLITVVLASALHEKYFGVGGKQEVFGVKFNAFKGKDLDGIRYEQLLPYAQPTDGDAFRVIIGDFVTTEDGTGIVHIAPSFGADDMRVAKQNGIGSLTLVNRQGKFVDEVTHLAGEYVKADYYTPDELAKELERQKAKYTEIALTKYMSADEQITYKLKLANKAFKVEKYEHNYPHCWRTNKPILYYPLDSWFIRTTAVKDRLVELNKSINWKPSATGTGRFGNWLENLVDWNLSRSRYWGTPLPIWRTEDATEEICIGSIAELREQVAYAVEKGAMSAPLAADFDLHKPYVDELVLVSAASGKPMRREADLVDVWFDSGAMPYAQWHYPFENLDKFKSSFPADFISEGVDQTRGWFFTLHVLSTLLFDSVAYKNVVSNGLVLDKDGNKMSKSLGNTVDPFTTLDKFGADATRWYMMSNAQPWDNLKFDVAGIGEVQRKFFGTLYNTYAFFSLYANIDGFVMDEMNVTPVKDRKEIDRWIISKLNSLVKDVDANYADYEPTKASRLIQEFVDEQLSNWYVRLCRKRFWRGEMTDDKKAAYETLSQCLLTVAQLMSPIAPFFLECLYKNLTDSIREKAKANNTPLQYDSVHLTSFSKPQEELIDADLEISMQMAQDASSLVLSLRKKENIRVRQPLQRILVPVLSDEFQRHFSRIEDLVLAEVNVKEAQYIRDTDGFIKKRIKPNFKALGSKLGPKMKDVGIAVSAFTQEDIAVLERDGVYSLNLNGEKIDLTLAEVEISSEDIPGWLVASQGSLTVALDITISDELKNEGNARELINRIQNLRKDKDFNLTDRIQVQVKRHVEIDNAILNFKDYICTEVLAENLLLADNVTNADTVEVNGIELKVLIQKTR
ncbi:isoleucine--tRNA ligase [soil metagenome]